MIGLLLAGLPGAAESQVKYIDTHAHLFGFGKARGDYAGHARTAVAAMDKLGAALTIVAALPVPPGLHWTQDADELFKGTKDFPGRFAVVAGGGSLHPMILEAASAGSTSDSLRRKFIATAEKLAKLPIVAFGEMATDHFSMADWHPYQHAPADHPLYLALADIAAEHDLPIDLHMEAIETPASLNPRYRSSLNPAKLVPNIPAFERLLAHNRKARIIWTHVGWDNAGQRTPALTRRLLAAHPNLYLAIKLAQGTIAPDTPFFVRGSGRIHPAWRAVIDEFPDRFMVGTDEFHIGPASDRRKIPQHAGSARLILNSLPPALARRIGIDNPLTVYPRLRDRNASLPPSKH